MRMIQFSHEISKVEDYTPQEARVMVERVMDVVVKKSDDVAWLGVAEAVHKKATTAIELMKAMKAMKGLKPMKVMKPMKVR